VFVAAAAGLAFLKSVGGRGLLNEIEKGLWKDNTNAQLLRITGTRM